MKATDTFDWGEMMVLAMVAGMVAGCGSPSAEQTSSESVPDVPSWAVELVGKPLRPTFPADGNCVGFADAVQTSYSGATPGVKIRGWGWDLNGKQAPPRIVLVDRDQNIVGAGEPGVERPDVPKARPEITSSNTGFWAMTKLTKGSVDVLGVLRDGKTVCQLGHIDF